MDTFKTLKDIGDVRGKKVIVRSELNAPIENGKVSDNYRIEKASPTLKKLSELGAKVIVTAHLGRNPEDSLRPVYEELKKVIPSTKFVPDLIGDEARSAIDSLGEGEVLLLENVRCNEGEKNNDEEFGRTLASLADYYVSDAFGAAHREHASVVGIPRHIPSYAGLLMEREIKELKNGLKPESPSLFILGGAKFDTKEPLLKAVVDRYDQVFIGGALANDFLKAKGFEVGASVVSEGAENIHEILESEKILLPTDVVVEGEHGAIRKSIADVGVNEKIVDVGPESITELGMRIARAEFILWNGPLGFYEGGYTEGTRETAQLVAVSKGYSIIGGGDTVAAIRDLDLEEKMNFISTGGGAMLEFLVRGELPGIKALET